MPSIEQHPSQIRQRSVHGRLVKNIVLPIVNNNTLRWVDKEKGLAWFSSASQYVRQEITKQDLDSAAKVRRKYEIPAHLVTKWNGIHLDLLDIAF